MSLGKCNMAALVVDCSGCCHFILCPHDVNSNFTFANRIFRVQFFFLFYDTHVLADITCSLLLNLCHVGLG